MELELRDIHKHYVQKRANDGISLKISPGKILGILGENGAGKSTLMKILSGFITRTSGKIILDGSEVSCSTPAEASSMGIGMLYQDPLDFPPLSVLDNFMIGQVSGLANRRTELRKRMKDLCSAFGFNLNPESSARSLTIGERQQLELIRLLSLGIKVLIMDEPTTGISGYQKEVLFSALKKLAHKGMSIVLVSHKLEDVEALCDTVTVFREGKVTGSMDQPFDTSGLLLMMFGTPPQPAERTRSKPTGEIFRFEGISAPGGRAGLSGCSVGIRKGEVVGLAGLEGSGQDVFLRVASGLTKPKQGKIFINGIDMTGSSYHTLRQSGIAFQPASRLEEGLIPGLTITEHCALQQTGTSYVVRWDRSERAAQEKIAKFHVIGRPASPVDSLSGGNQQRLLLSFLPEEAGLLLIENPTRGLDMESVHWVWAYLDTYVRRGATIVFSSSDLDEILMVADRVLVFFGGSVIKDEHPEETNAMELGRAIAGKV
jgi:general nucleoside transport system ATP-binding protein